MESLGVNHSEGRVLYEYMGVLISRDQRACFLSVTYKDTARGLTSGNKEDDLH